MGIFLFCSQRRRKNRRCQEVWSYSRVMWREKKDYDISYKVVLLGETFVGKTALLNYLQGEPLDKQPMPTIGAHLFRLGLSFLSVREMGGKRKFPSN